MTDDDTMALLVRVRWIEAEVQRLIEHAAQAEPDLQSLLNSIYAAGNGTGCLNAHELRQALDAAVRKRDVLAAEVEAWRRTFDEETGKQIGDSSDCRDVSAARAVTDECGALTRAKEAK
jgi:hypothetical protein